MKRDNIFAGYDSFFLAEEKYTQGAALQKLREELRAFKGIHSGFLKSLERDEAFCTDKYYIPVYRLSATAEYTWRSAARSAAATSEKKSRRQTYAEHREERKIECLRFRAPERLDPKSRQDGLRPLAEENKKSVFASLYPDSRLTLKENAKELKRTAADYSPDSGAQILLGDIKLEVIFVPVLRAVCKYEEEEYACFINLHNGACTLEYPVSARVEEEVEQALQKLSRAKLCIGFSALFILVFAVLSLIKFLRPEKAVAAATVAVLFALLLVPFPAFLKCLGYNREKMIKKAGGTGKASGVLTAAVLIVLSWLAAAVSLVVFAVYAL